MIIWHFYFYFSIFFYATHPYELNLDRDSKGNVLVCYNKSLSFREVATERREVQKSQDKENRRPNPSHSPPARANRSQSADSRQAGSPDSSQNVAPNTAAPNQAEEADSRGITWRTAEEVEEVEEHAFLRVRNRWVFVGKPAKHAEEICPICKKPADHHHRAQ